MSATVAAGGLVAAHVRERRVVEAVRTKHKTSALGAGGEVEYLQEDNASINVELSKKSFLFP